MNRTSIFFPARGSNSDCSAFHHCSAKGRSAAGTSISGRLKPCSTNFVNSAAVSGAIAKRGHLIEPCLEDRLHVAFSKNGGRSFRMTVGEMLQANRQRIPHFFQRRTYAFQLSQIDKVRRKNSISQRREFLCEPLGFRRVRNMFETQQQELSTCQRLCKYGGQISGQLFTGNIFRRGITIRSGW